MSEEKKPISPQTDISSSEQQKIKPPDINPFPNMPYYIGPYHVIETLGRGAMGVIYRAIHQKTRQEVALKTIRLARANLLQGIRREIYALRRVKHSGIVQILDDGIQDGIPWYAMEFFTGISLAKWIHQSEESVWKNSYPEYSDTSEQKDATFAFQTIETNQNLFQSKTTLHVPWQSKDSTVLREPVSETLSASSPNPPPAQKKFYMTPRMHQAFTILYKVCTSLAHLHGEGLVHRDLKPENLLLRSPLEPVLVDFGLTTHFFGERGRESLATERGKTGTIYYMAPEQIRGEFVDARADLYSLGCILFELLIGHPPFTGNTVEEILEKHLSQSPPRLSSYFSDLPPFLDILQAKLLTKNPQHRLGYADMVAVSLTRSGILSVPQNTVQSTHSYLYRPGLQGRKNIILSFRKQLSMTEKNQGKMVLVGGESGVGKTRLALELSKEAEKERFLVLSGECSDTEVLPLQALRKPLQILVDRCLSWGKKEAEWIFGKRGPILAPYELRLAELPGLPHDILSYSLPPKEARQRLFHALTECFLTLTKERPLFLLLDDLQWADALSLSWLLFLVQNQTLLSNRMLIWGMYRSEEKNTELSTLLGKQTVQQVLLSRLARSDVASIVRDMLALDETPDEFSEFLFTHSEGNPFFVAEYLRTAVAKGIFTRDQEGGWQILPVRKKNPDDNKKTTYHSLALPDTLRALITQRFQKLSTDARVVLYAMAVLGRESEGALLSLIANLDETELLEAIYELKHKEIFEEAESGNLRFLHDKLREVAYEIIPENSRRALHQSAALSMETLYRNNKQYAKIIGRQWAEANKAQNAQKYFLLGAIFAKDQYHQKEAEQLYQAYFQTVPSITVESIQARLDFGEHVLLSIGKTGKAEEVLQEALRLAEEIVNETLQMKSSYQLGQLYRQKSDYQSAKEHYQKALTIAKRINDYAFEGVVLSGLANSYLGVGLLEKAKTLYQKTLRIHKKTQNFSLEGNVLANLALVLVQQGFLEEAEHSFIKALRILETTNAHRVRAAVLGNLAVLYHEQGFEEKALTYYQKQLNLTKETGNRRLEGIALSGFGNVYLMQKRFAASEEVYQKALRIHRACQNLRFEGMVLSNLAILYHEQGLREKADSFYQNAWTIYHKAGVNAGLGAVLCAWGKLLRQTRQSFIEAREKNEESIRIFEKGGFSISLAKSFCEEGHLVLTNGKSAKPILQKIDKLLLDFAKNPSSLLQENLDRLHRAQRAFEKKEVNKLFQGECIFDIPPGVRQYLYKNNYLSKKQVQLSLDQQNDE